MLAIKLIIITFLLYFISKSYAIILEEKTTIKKEIALGLGYILNIVTFSICTFIPMYFKMSSFWLNIFGILYLIISIISIIYSIKNKKLFKFSKKEIIALIITFGFSICYALFLDFGSSEMFDTYFYSVLTNSASNAEKLATINPYNGIGDLQNFYKYIAYYYQSSFFANIFFIKPAHLVLIWPFMFMNYFFISITALGLVRISKKEYINNILSAFLLTFYTTFFRAPSNAVHLVNIIIPIYMIYFALKSFKDSKNLFIYYLIFIGAAACSSAILYTSATFILVLFILNCIKKDGNIKNVFLLSIPTYLLAVQYMIEQSRSLLTFLISLLILVLIYFLLNIKLVRYIVKYIGILFIVAIPALFIYASYSKNISSYTDLFRKQGTVSDKNVTTSSGNICITDYLEVKDVNINKDYNRFSSAMKYIYENSHSKINTMLILITHSVLLYGGLLFLFLYYLIKDRKNPIFLAFVIYVILFFNPFVTKGLSVLTLGLNARIYLFFNTFFALNGMSRFFDYVESFDNKNINRLLKIAYIPYILLLCMSIMSYLLILKKPDYKNINFLYKVPNNLVLANSDINKLIKKNKIKPNVLYLTDTFNLSMIDNNPNNKYKVIDSKEYKSYYFTPNIVNNKMLINLYFESNGEEGIDYLKENLVSKTGEINYDKCEILSMLKDYNIKYIVMDKKNIKSYDGISRDYSIKYNKNNVVLLERK